VSGPRDHADGPTRASRAAFASGAAVALYTSAGFGALLFLGAPPAAACAVSAACGVAGAAVAGALARRAEERARASRVAKAQLETARARALGSGGPAGGALPRAEAATRAPRGTREERESREIQAALLPRAVPEVAGYHLEADYLPCGALGGDFYDFRALAEDRLLVTLGDVSGKGPAGAIVMAMVQTLFREHAAQAAGPADLLARVNAGFRDALSKGIFVTAIAALLDPRRHRLTLAAAGHHPVLLLNVKERRTTRVGARGPALGLVGGPRFSEALVETTIDLAEGDALLFYTDGATDGVQDLASGVGEGRLLAAAAAAVLPGPEGALPRLSKDLWEGGGRRDDTTLLLLSRVGAAAPARGTPVSTPDQIKT